MLSSSGSPTFVSSWLSRDTTGRRGPKSCPLSLPLPWSSIQRPDAHTSTCPTGADNAQVTPTDCQFANACPRWTPRRGQIFFSGCGAYEGFRNQPSLEFPQKKSGRRRRGIACVLVVLLSWLRSALPCSPRHFRQWRRSQHSSTLLSGVSSQAPATHQEVEWVTGPICINN